MLSRLPGKKLTGYCSDYIVFDLETTGTSPNADDIIEISAVKVKNGAVVGEFTRLVNPGRPIPYQASMVNGITDDMVKDAPMFDEVFDEFLEFIGDFVLVGHNIHCFDMKFLYRYAKVIYGKTLDNDYIDTVPMAKKYLPQMAHHRLTDLASHYGIKTDGAHRALYDCQMNQQVFELLHKEMENPSNQVLGEKCPKCGSDLKLRNGVYGEFWGCMGFPNCRYTKNVGR